MTQTLTGLFDRYDDARRAVQDLEAAGVAHRDISLVANDVRGAHRDELDPVAQDAGAGASIGAAVGGLGGLLAGLGLLAIPGIGPVVAAGWLAATAAGAAGGAVIGGIAGGLVGALTHAGVPEADAHVYAEGVRRGGTLVTAKVDEPLVPTARAILSDDRTVNIADRRRAYEGEGWSRFDEAAPSYSADEIEAERMRFERS
ncbi:hypothetical protein HZF05_21545 [Sphingomonas sp. CGMCC 1.13654]|uniref:General stress protein 17M-like domain-containing protein n=1 Tax=Sphingomonas chungangi TaxID=2683589 RepID=A0A838LCR4_9SPHN|nr:general stress protein [Sphingomonas chungangi]MBA2936672.1 hypothetical protein [Sphingomonas chungangi]MVW56057.1 hypothetical protein [Sphingomonas chungangi]